MWNGCPDDRQSEICEESDSEITDPVDDSCANVNLLQAQCLDSLIVQLTREYCFESFYYF